MVKLCDMVKLCHLWLNQLTGSKNNKENLKTAKTGSLDEIFDI
jgi:hypothetical protein